jgi:2-polyprenyl-6-methoxyphenol hydroxylase-like FAD-dependent oxidoreductase
MKSVDVLVLGGGPSGLVTAMELRRLGLTVVVAEASQLSTPKLGETLSSQAMCLLQRLGLEEAFQCQGHTAVQAIRSSWGSSALDDQLAMFDPHGSGWHLDRYLFDSMLLNHARNRGVDVRLRTRVLQSQWEGKHWETQLRIAGKRSSLSSAFLVDATGRGGYLSARFSSQRENVDHLIGVARFFSDHTGRNEPWTLVEAISDGWWYSAPLPHIHPNRQRGNSGNMLAVFMTDADLLSSVTEIDSMWQKWLEQSEHTGHRLDKLEPVTKSRVYSAKTCFSHSYSGENWLSVGDAALAYDPLAGQGLKLALETGIAAAYAISERRTDEGIALERYRQSLEVTWSNYLRQRSEIYNREKRWSQATFWRRRHVPH